MAPGLVNKAGGVVRGVNFFNRDEETKELTWLLDENNSVLLVAPRRVGKTSLVRETFRRMEKRKKDFLIYIDVEDCRTPSDLIVALGIEIHKHARLQNVLSKAFQLLERVEKVSVGGAFGIKLRDQIQGDWKEKGRTLFSELANADLPVVICFDELPVMVSRMLSDRENSNQAKRIQEVDIFLSWLRKNMQEYHDKLRCIICGSIGLEPILHRHGLSKTINHLSPFHLGSWSRETATTCLEQLALREEINWESETLNHLLDYLPPYIPYHVQLFFSHLRYDCKQRNMLTPTVEEVDRVYHTVMLGTRGHAELATYEERLKQVFGADAEMHDMAFELLTAASTGELSRQEAGCIAKSHGLHRNALELMNVLDILEHDGYLAQHGAKKSWKFESVILRDWWNKRHQQST